MAEIIDIFPSKYIHIGGDEAPRTRWEKCPKCQARIRTEKLKADKNHTAEDRLQSYCMTRIEKLLNSKGRRLSAGMRFWKATSPPTQLLCHGVARQEESRRPNWDTT